VWTVLVVGCASFALHAHWWCMGVIVCIYTLYNILSVVVSSIMILEFCSTSRSLIGTFSCRSRWKASVRNRLSSGAVCDSGRNCNCWPGQR
jgi:dolichol kinase